MLESNIDRSKASRYFKDYLENKPKDKEVWIKVLSLESKENYQQF